MVGRNRSEGEKGAKWRNGSTSRHGCLALAADRTCCLSLLLRGKGDVLRANGLVGGVSSVLRSNGLKRRLVQYVVFGKNKLKCEC